jgi:glycosyltransferase involved in cell wall biosynthesis
VAPVIAAVIPTRDRATVPRAVESVLSQDVEAEVIPVVVDDGSRTPVGEELVQRFPGIEVRRHDEPRGPGAARNTGAEAVVCDFVAYLDDDDRWLPGKLRHCLDCLDRYPEAGLVAHQVARAARQGHGGGCRRVGEPVRRMMHAQPPHLAGVVIRRAVHDRVRFDESFWASEDTDYLLRAAIEAPVVEIDRVLALHGPVGANPSQLTLELRIENRRRLQAKHQNLFDRRARSFSDMRLGHLYRRSGRRARAVAAFARAALRRPLWASPWKGMVAVGLPSGAVDRLAGGGE